MDNKTISPSIAAGKHHLGMPLEDLDQLFLHYLVHDSPNLRVAETILRLAFKLRVRHLDADHRRQALP